MAYVKTDWVNNVTPVDDTRMDNIEQGIFDADAAAFAAVAKDSVVVAATRIVASKLAGGDTQPAFRILGDGKHEWGLGGTTAPDINLYRGGANILQSDDIFTALVFRTGTGSNTVEMYNDGKIYWGNPSDVVLYRNAANQLKTDSYFYAAGEVVGRYGSPQSVKIGYIGAGVAGIYFGSAEDTNLYRSAADTLKTDDTFQSASLVSANTGTANQVTLGHGGSGVAPAMTFGSAGDTNLYRSAADTLKTDDAMHVGTALAVDVSNVGGKLYFGSAADTNLYRVSASTLGTDQFFRAYAVTTQDGLAGQIKLWSDGKIYFGSANDTYLYRSGAGVLKTDGKLHVTSHLMLETAVSGAVGGSQPYKVPIYNQNDTLLGYVPIYET